MGPKSKDELANLLRRLQEEIIPLFDKAVSNNNIVFPNPNLVECWQAMKCKSTECTLHGSVSDNKTDRCWQIAGTYCGGKPQGTFVQKYGDCRECGVFKKSCPSIVEEIGEHFNNMVYLMRKQGGKMLEDKDRIEKLNKEMTSVLEQLNLKNKEFQQMMITDRLTRLFDRHHLISLLDDEIARCHRCGHSLALMMIDIDGFKVYNETYGYKAGDKMLSYAGTLIKKNIRKFDKAFRYSAKEFIIILPETDMTLAYIVAERIRKSFERKTFSVSNKKSGLEEKVSGSFSIGISSVFNYTTSSNAGVEDLINQTAQSVHKAREKGGNLSVRSE